MRFRWLWFLCMLPLLGLSVVTPGALAAEGSRPNIVLILVDDMGYADIGESTNVAADHPEEVERLRGLADQIKDDLGLDGIGPGCRPLGRVADAQPIISHDGTFRKDLGE